MAKKFELVRPRSLTDSDIEPFEYLIRWIGRDGSDYLLMFYDAELNHSINSEIINTESNVEALISGIENRVILFADDLTLSDLVIVLQLFENKFVTRIFKSGTTERYAPEPNSFTYRLMAGRYEISISLKAVNGTAWK